MMSAARFDMQLVQHRLEWCAATNPVLVGKRTVVGKTPHDSQSDYVMMTYETRVRGESDGSRLASRVV